MSRSGPIKIDDDVKEMIELATSSLCIFYENQGLTINDK